MHHKVILFESFLFSKGISAVRGLRVSDSCPFPLLWSKNRYFEEGEQKIELFHVACAVFNEKKAAVD